MLHVLKNMLLIFKRKKLTRKKQKMVKGKRSQSDIVATLLIVLFVIIAGALLLRFLVPFVGGWLSKGDCYQFNGKIEIKNNPAYTCYDSNINTLYLQVSFGDIDSNSKNTVTGLAFVAQTETSSTNYEMTPPNSNPPGVSLLTGAIGEILMRNQERTFKIMNISKPSSVIIYPLIDKKRKCTESKSTMEFIPDCDSHYMSVNSSAFISGGEIPVVGLPTGLSIFNIPVGTKSLVVIVEDINDSTATGDHWVAWNIPATPATNKITLGNIAAGGVQLGPYDDPNPPVPVPPSTAKVTHYYTFTVYAIKDLTITPTANTKAKVIEAMQGKRLTEATLYGKIKGV